MSEALAQAQIEDIVETFDLLGDWEARYQYLVELGERLPAMDTADQADANRVKECMSLVHVAAHPVGDGRIRYSGDCDTAIIKGVVALLVELFSDKTPVEIEDLDVDELFTGLHLDEHLSPNRHVGVYAIVGKMKAQAAAYAP
ncbi:SufE family protein [Thiococcus pfennigii]|jgi:cysteine desulfuration protein SufE|uniref:SufE family protein n=1 Tax=Thiococcus pfennigii TaxID=1057 RepID=UPI001908BFDA|nr:SufE family protein [Thiococcus pfennigii]MBK1700508.1 Fe-S metabolism protein SufE [Thiococcus pfennigii]MBK1733028.1 Fe-S metabolism protein SufE [Thiococcus pfennigii]